MNLKLLLIPYPPPYAGPEIASQMLLQTEALNRNDIIYINSNIRKSNANKGKFDIQGIITFVKKYSMVLKYLINPKIKTFYFVLSSSKIGFARDIFYIISAKLFGCRIIGHYRGSNFDGFYKSQNVIYKKIIKISLNLIDNIIVQGQSIKPIFKNIFPINNIKVLYNGIDIKNFSPKDTYDQYPFIIFFMGHLIYSKGFYDLVGAYKILYKKYGNDIKFIFAGENIGFNKRTAEFLDSQYKNDFLRNGKRKSKEIQQFIETCKQYNAEYKGLVSGIEKLHLFHKSSVFVLPSYTEGFSMACLEAMACGLPVITTPVGAMPEVVKHGVNGLITEVGNPEKLAESIEYFIKNPQEKERIGKTNIAYVKENFDIEKIAKRLIEILDE